MIKWIIKERTRVIAFIAIVCISSVTVGQVLNTKIVELKLKEYDSIEPHLTTNQKINSLYFILNIANNIKDEGGQSNCLRRLGIVYGNTAMQDSAVIMYVNSAKLASKVKYILSEASSFNQIGLIYKEQKKSTLALEYFKGALNIYSQIPDHRGMSDATYNIAETQFNDGQSDSAYINCLQSLGYMRRWGDTSTVGYNYDLLSKIELRKTKPQKALVYSKQAIGLLKKDKDFTGLIPALNQLGKVCSRLNMPDSSIRCYHEAFGLALTLGYKTYLPETAASLAEQYELLGLQDSLVKYLKIRQTYTDSLNDEIAKRATAESLAKFDNEKNKLDLQHEKQLSANRNTMNYVLASLALILALSILLMWRSFRQQRNIKQKESELQQANAQLQGQDAERERIAGELHDRVGAMLSTAKLQFSAMEEQAKQFIKGQHQTFEKALRLLDETYEEVRRISHNLDTGDLRRLGFKKALQQRIQRLSETDQLQAQFIDNQLPPELYAPFANDLFSITMLLLDNTLKHAGAREVSIQLSRTNGNLVYSYEDDGRGFDREALKQNAGMGYRNLEARVQKMKGSWHLDTSPGHGLNLIIELPLSGS